MYKQKNDREIMGTSLIGSRIASPSALQQKTEKTEQIKCSSSHSHAQPSGALDLLGFLGFLL
jgi:hypothetical protein